MAFSPIPAPALLALLLLAGGCAQRGSFPSLAPRAAEMADAGAPAAAPAPEAPDDPALARRLAELLGRAREGQTAFAAAMGRASPAVARGGGAGSESWVVAQQAISRIEEARAPTVEALADLDAVPRAREESGTPTSSNDRAAIAAAVEEVRAIAARQQQDIAGLSGSLSDR